MSEKRGLNNGAPHCEEKDSKNGNMNVPEEALSVAKKQKTVNDDSKKSDESSNAEAGEVSSEKQQGGVNSEENVDESKNAKLAPEVGTSSSESAAINSKASQEIKVKHEVLSANALVIFGLHPLVKKEEMQEVLEKFGEVERVEIKKAFASSYCFCDYKTNEEAKAAIEKLNGTDLRGKSLIVKLANDKNDRAKPFSGN